MPAGSFDTLLLHDCVARYQAGDAAAADQLLRVVAARMQCLTQRMLRRFPNVRECAETADVLQSSTLRLLNTLRKMAPTSTRHFFNLVALHIRRELLDLARALVRRPVTLAAALDSKNSHAVGVNHVADPLTETAEDLELWRRFHENVDTLPEDTHEVLSLCFYNGWTQEQVAEFLDISVRTVRTRWQTACVQLNRLMGGQLPPL